MNRSFHRKLWKAKTKIQKTAAKKEIRERLRTLAKADPIEDFKKALEGIIKDYKTARKDKLIKHNEQLTILLKKQQEENKKDKGST